MTTALIAMAYCDAAEHAHADGDKTEAARCHDIAGALTAWLEHEERIAA